MAALSKTLPFSASPLLTVERMWDAASTGGLGAGVLLHTGTQSVTVGDRLHLRPIRVLWSNQV